MLVLFETPAGYALFKVLDEGKLKKADLSSDFQTIDAAKKIVQLKEFRKFKDISEAVSAATAMVESKVTKDLKKFLKSSIVEKKLKDTLAVCDIKLAGAIKEKLSIPCVYDDSVLELMRGIREQLHQLLSGVSSEESLTSSHVGSMVLGLSHSLSRYKLKFSADKVDTMIVQAIGLLDDLDKELNTYGMRVKEWYGWHFPELAKILPDNVLFAKTVLKLGSRANAETIDLSDVLPEITEKEVKQAAIISMGTEVTEDDMSNIHQLCTEVVAISESRAQLYDYIKSRMQAIAPNLTVLVGELVGARLIAHAGSLLNLAKHPASTVQILGAEKALFRALKSKKDTPKYGLIFHASLIGQAHPKHKGKISRVLAAKCALSARVDALSEREIANVGVDARAKVEGRLRSLEGGHSHKLSSNGGSRQQQAYDSSHKNGVQRAPLKTFEEEKKPEPVQAVVESSDKKDKKAEKALKKAEKKAKKEAEKAEKAASKAEKADKKAEKAEKKAEKAEKKVAKEAEKVAEEKKEKKDKKKRKREEKEADGAEDKKDKKDKKKKKAKKE